MKNCGQYPIWLRGSKATIWRAVWEDEDGKTFIKYYGQKVYVEHMSVGYSTIELF